jgi:hypothetical protein
LQISTRAEVLEKMSDQHPICGVISDWRKLNKCLRDFIMALADRYMAAPGAWGAANAAAFAAPSVMLNMPAADAAGGPFMQGSDPAAGAAPSPSLSHLPIHIIPLRGRFLQTTAETGRVQMDEPNLQQIPRPATYFLATSASQAARLGLNPGAVVPSPPGALPGHSGNANKASRTAAGGPAPQVQELRVNVRRAFVPREPGYVLLSADYCQLELRVMAQLSGEEKLVEAFT